MKLLLDQGLPRSLAELLRQTDIDTIHVGEIGFSTATDEEILTFARSQQRIVVTLDADFHALLALSAATTPATIRIRIEGLKAEPMAELLMRILLEWRDELLTGVAMTIQPNRIRIHRLPLVSRLN